MEIRLKQARILKGETIREAAKGLGLSHNGLHKYEQGLIKMDSEKIIKFANYYGVSVDYILPSPNREKVEFKNIQFHKLKYY